MLARLWRIAYKQPTWILKDQKTKNSFGLFPEQSTSTRLPTPIMSLVIPPTSAQSRLRHWRARRLKMIWQMADG